MVGCAVVLALVLVAVSHSGAQAASCPPASGDAYSTAVLADSPVAYYRLDESSGTTMCDSSSTAANGTYNGSGITYGVSGALAGDPDTAVAADGSSGVIGTGGTSPVTGNHSFTLEGWYRQTGTTQDQAVVDIGKSTPGVSGTIAGLATWHSVSCTTGSTGSSEVGLDLFGESNCWDTSPAGVNLYDGNWHYLAVTYDSTSGNVTGYVDGQSLGVETPGASINLDSGSNPIRVGYWIDTFLNQPFNGDADEVAVYDSALSSARIQAHFQADQAQQNPPPPPPPQITATSTTTTTTETYTQPPGRSLGGLDLDGYCRAQGYAGSQVKGGANGPNQAYQWNCVTSSGALVPISLQDACNFQYPKQESLAFVENPNDANSWVCVASNGGRLAIAGEYAPSGNLAVGSAAKLVKQVPTGGSALAVQTQGSCQLALNERPVGGSARASAARGQEHRLGLIKPVTEPAAGRGLHLLPIELTAKGKRLVRRLHRRGHRAAAIAAASGDPINVTCTPRTYPTYTGDGSTLAPNIGSKPAPVPTPPSTSKSAVVPIAQVSTTTTPHSVNYGGTDSLHDRVSFDVGPDGSVSGLVVELTLRCTKAVYTSQGILTVPAKVKLKLPGLTVKKPGMLTYSTASSNPPGILTVSASLTDTSGFLIVNFEVDPVKPLNDLSDMPIGDTDGAACNNAPGAGQFILTGS